MPPKRRSRPLSIYFSEWDGNTPTTAGVSAAICARCLQTVWLVGAVYGSQPASDPANVNDPVVGPLPCTQWIADVQLYGGIGVESDLFLTLLNAVNTFREEHRGQETSLA